MSTRTAIFKEQENGDFLGIYCHHDGYIDGVGATLLKHYKDPKKTQQLIDKKTPLSSLGTEPVLAEVYDRVSGKYRLVDEANCGVIDINMREQYLASSIDELQNIDYKTIDESGKVQGFTKTTHDKKEIFIPYKGSDNNGFIYVQMLNGKWKVSEFQKKFRSFK